MTDGIYLRIDEELLKKLDSLAQKLGYTRSETIREAIKQLILSVKVEEETTKMRGIIKSKLSLKELEEAYVTTKCASTS